MSYLIFCPHNIIEKDIFDIIEKCINYFELMTGSLSNIIIAIGGLMGILYFNKLREKQLNASFSFLAQLQVRLKILNDTFEGYEDQIMERMLPEGIRRKEPDRVFIKNIIQQFANDVAETLEFLKKAEEQMPASVNWSTKLQTLLEFLGDMKNLSNISYYKWVEDENSNSRKAYAEKHRINIQQMLKDIDDCQKSNAEKYFEKKEKGSVCLKNLWRR